jgi:hypothetical protein
MVTRWRRGALAQMMELRGWGRGEGRDVVTGEIEKNRL